MCSSYQRIIELIIKCNIFIVSVIFSLTVLIAALSIPLANLFVSSDDSEDKNVFIKTAATSLIMAIIGLPFGGTLMMCSGYY